MPIPEQLGFLHIPKTGGRTMTTICRHFYRPDECEEWNFENPAAIEGKAFVHSHFPYDRLPPTADRLVFTLLREPAARIVSYYYMCKRSRPQDWSLYSTFWQGGGAMPLRDFAANRIGMTSQVRNAMTRQLAGYDLLTSERAVNAGDVAIALNNLENLMVGFVGAYDAFVERLCARMGWKKPRYSAQNVSINYDDEVSASDLAEIRGLNKWDVMLYEEAVKRYA